LSGVTAQSSRLAEFGGLGMSFNICRGATLTDGAIDRIEGFATEGDAGRWIKNESAGWLYAARTNNKATP